MLHLRLKLTGKPMSVEIAEQQDGLKKQEAD